MCQTQDNQSPFQTTAITTAGHDPSDIQATHEAILDVVARHYAAVEDGTATIEQIQSCIALKAMLDGVILLVRNAHSRALTEWISRNGEVTIGQTRYYVGTERKTRLARKDAAVLAILESGGDIEALADCIAANGIKPGAFKKLVGEEKFNECFTVETVNCVETGKPVRAVRAVNAQFARKAEGESDAVDCE